MPYLNNVFCMTTKAVPILKPFHYYFNLPNNKLNHFKFIITLTNLFTISFSTPNLLQYLASLSFVLCTLISYHSFSKQIKFWICFSFVELIFLYFPFPISFLKFLNFPLAETTTKFGMQKILFFEDNIVK